MFPLSRSWISTETQISWLENQDQLDYVTTGARSWHWNYRVKKKIDFYLWNLVDWFHNFGHNTSLSLIQSLSLAIPIPLQQTMNSSFITGGDHILPTCSGNKNSPILLNQEKIMSYYFLLVEFECFDSNWTVKLFIMNNFTLFVLVESNIYIWTASLLLYGHKAFLAMKTLEYKK